MCINSVSQLFIVLFNRRLREQLLKPCAPLLLSNFPSRSPRSAASPSFSFPRCQQNTFFLFKVLPVCFNSTLARFHSGSCPPPSVAHTLLFWPFVLEPQVGARKSKGSACVSSARCFTVEAAVWQRPLGSWLHFSGLSTVILTDQFFFFLLLTLRQCILALSSFNISRSLHVPGRQESLFTASGAFLAPRWDSITKEA